MHYHRDEDTFKTITPRSSPPPSFPLNGSAKTMHSRALIIQKNWWTARFISQFFNQCLAKFVRFEYRSDWNLTEFDLEFSAEFLHQYTVIKPNKISFYPGAANLISRFKWSPRESRDEIHTRMVLYISLTLYWLMKYQHSRRAIHLSTDPFTSTLLRTSRDKSCARGGAFSLTRKERISAAKGEMRGANMRSYREKTMLVSSDSDSHAWRIVCAGCHCRKWQDIKLWPVVIPPEFHTQLHLTLFASSLSLSLSVSSRELSLCSFVSLYVSLSLFLRTIPPAALSIEKLPRYLMLSSVSSTVLCLPCVSRRLLHSWH